MPELQGLYCPGCGQLAALALPGQAWCGTDDCAVLAWNPRHTLAELTEDIMWIGGMSECAHPGMNYGDGRGCGRPDCPNHGRDAGGN
jgi:hypothetical protein